MAATNQYGFDAEAIQALQRAFNEFGLSAADASGAFALLIPPLMALDVASGDIVRLDRFTPRRRVRKVDALTRAVRCISPGGFE